MRNIGSLLNGRIKNFKDLNRFLDLFIKDYYDYITPHSYIALCARVQFPIDITHISTKSAGYYKPLRKSVTVSYLKDGCVAYDSGSFKKKGSL